MKTGTMLSIALLCASVSAARAESYYVVKLTDRAGVVSYDVVTANEFRVLQADVQEELKLYPKALAMAREVWAKDKTESKSFPIAAIHRRGADAAGPAFTNRDKAEEKRSRLLDRLWDKDKDDAKSEQERLDKRFERVHEDERAEKRAELESKEKVKQAIEDKARDVYETELARLSPRLVPAPAAPAPAAPKP